MWCTHDFMISRVVLAARNGGEWPNVPEGTVLVLGSHRDTPLGLAPPKHSS